ncbi:MAG: hypothetical protein JSS66_16600 [Armatimonadetes bacterium]|nr:hypothetical protein [Armatimonadota bacterium]
MRKASMSLPEIGAIALTRGLGGAGAALLMSDKVPEKRKKTIGIALLAVGALSTVPLLIDLFQKLRGPAKGDPESNSPRRQSPRAAVKDLEAIA